MFVYNRAVILFMIINYLHFTCLICNHFIFSEKKFKQIINKVLCMCCLMLSSVIIMLLVFYLNIRRNQISRQNVYGYYMNLSILQNNLYKFLIIVS